MNAESFRDDLAEAKEQYLRDIEAKPDLLDELLERYRRDGFLDLNSLDIPGLSDT